LLDHLVLPDLSLPSTLSVPLPLKEPVFGKKTATLLPPLPSARMIKLLAVMALSLTVLLDISRDHLAVAPLLPLVELPLPYASGLLNAKLQLLAPRVLPLAPALKNSVVVFANKPLNLAPQLLLVLMLITRVSTRLLPATVLTLNVYHVLLVPLLLPPEMLLASTLMMP
jgi:hypothetical protein